MIAQAFPLARFRHLHADLGREFECLTPGAPDTLYCEYLAAGRESTAVRYARPGTFVPNVEFEFARKTLDFRAVRRRLRVNLNGHALFVGPLELQIAYKLYMGSPKDFEDARWIYRIAGEHLDEAEIWQAAEALDVTLTEGREVLGIR